MNDIHFIPVNLKTQLDVLCVQVKIIVALSVLRNEYYYNAMHDYIKLCSCVE